MQSSDTYISPNSIPALKCDRRFELQQTYHKIFKMGWGFETMQAAVCGGQKMAPHLTKWSPLDGTHE